MKSGRSFFFVRSTRWAGRVLLANCRCHDLLFASLLPKRMSDEPSVSSPKHKKRVPQLVAFYEEIGTPKSRKKRSSPDTLVNEVELSPTKKSKLEEPEVVEELPVMEVEEEVVVIEEVEEEVAKVKESKSSRKSRRLKELTLTKYSKRIYGATEILSTERTYVEALQQLHNVRNHFYGRCPFLNLFPAPMPLTLFLSPISGIFIYQTALLTTLLCIVSRYSSLGCCFMNICSFSVGSCRWVFT